MLSKQKNPYSLAPRLLIAAALILFAAQTIDYLNFTVDDVFIPMRYAENAASGNGLVYNIGEYVEGYSDPLWVWVLTGAAKMGVNHSFSPLALMWFAKALSYFFGLLSLGLLYWFTLKIFSGDKFFASLSVLFAAMTAPFVAWSCGGLEMTLISFLYLSASCFAYFIFEKIKRGQKITVWQYGGFSGSFLMASLARPEPAFVAGIAFATLFIILPRNEKKRLVFFSFFPFLVFLGLFFLWRWNTYHDLLPNSYYSKTGGGILGYFKGAQYLFSSLGLICLPVFIFVPFAFKGWRQNYFLQFVGVLIAAVFSFIIYSTGDWMFGARFLIPIAPLLFLLAVIGLEQLQKNFGEKGFSPIGFALIFIFLGISSSQGERIAIRGKFNTMPTGFLIQPGHGLPFHEQAALWLKQTAHDSQVFATGEAGIIGYFNPNLRLVDLNGLMDRRIANERKHSQSFDTEYVLNCKPDYFLLYGDDGKQELMGHELSDNYTHVLRDNFRFRNEYRLEKHLGIFGVYIRN